MNYRFAMACLSVSVCVLTASACGRRDVIERYTVPKQPIIESSVSASTGTTDDNQDVDMTRDRMIGAVVPRGKQTWFFKVTGPNQNVADQMEGFLALIRSLRFAQPGDTPNWTLPEGWRREPASETRFATIEIDTGEEPLELSVIMLSTGSGAWDDYLLANINRWRGQLRLSPITIDQLFQKENRTEETIQLDLEDGTKVTLVNLVGFMGSSPMGRAPFAPFASQGAASGRPTAPRSKLQYEVPEGWKKSKGSALSKAAFAVTDGDQEVETTVTDLAAEAASLLPNVNRWRDQIGLADITQRELESLRKTIKVGELTGDYVELFGPETAKRRETILAVVVVEGGIAWFVRLRGDSSLAAREKQRFEEFVGSLRFNGNGADDGK